MLQPLFDIVRPYWPTLLFFVVFPVLAAIANWLLWWDTPERWEAFAAKHAGGIDTALLEELLGDFGAPGLIDRTDDVVAVGAEPVHDHAPSQ